MIIPKNINDRETLYSQLVKDCFASRNDRKARYDILRNWYLYGNEATQLPTEYNKLYAHVDLLASFLFSGETTKFLIEVPKTDEVNYDFEVDKAKILTPRVNETWHDSNTDVVFNDALNWALVYDTMILKFLPKGKSQFGSYAIEPHSFGVIREDVPDLTEQEVVCHEFFMTESELRRKVKHMSLKQQKDILSQLNNAEEARDENIMPGGVQALIINSTQPETGKASGEVNVNTLMANKFEPVISERGVVCYELWIYDDELNDYRKAIMVGGEKLLHDSEKNTFVAGELPFVKLTPNALYNYFWGRSELMYLIPLQQWLNVRVPEIKAILAKLADPPMSVWGTTDSRVEALRFAGGLFTSSDPASMGKIEKFYPATSTELFKELAEIEHMFSEVSGVREIMKGGGEPGVRAMGHADMLAKLGSTRAKKKAAILEDAAEKYATLILKCLRDYDATYFKSSNGTSFIAKQLTVNAEVKVDSHSSSPIFIEEQKETAQILFQAGAYDKEDLVDAMRIQNSGVIKAKIKAKEAKDAPLAKVQEIVESAKPEDSEGVVDKLKKMFKGGR